MTIIKKIFSQDTVSFLPVPAVCAECGQQDEKQDGTQTIVLGDCLETGSIDVTVTSPPYNIGIRYRSYDDRRPRQEYLAWMGEVAAQITRLLHDDGALFLNLGAGPDPWIATDVAAEFRKHLTLQNRISWIKSIAIGDRTSGHFKPINSKRYLNRTHEEIYHFTKRGDVAIDRLSIGVPYEDKSNIGRWDHANLDRRCAGNSWFIPYETVRNRAGKHDHPASFPLELPLRCLRMHGGKGAVFDPFAGAGTTLVAARALGWNGIGIEIGATYAQTARARLAEVRDG
ncbi:site-specific DNA-methyltransferase (adenine-specific) [Paracoccus pantotrophus]|nr:site-specific DNA-methyltransferase (adenine-specific) [Paracoccus pantotrophus]